MLELIDTDTVGGAGKYELRSETMGEEPEEPRRCFRLGPKCNNWAPAYCSSASTAEILVCIVSVVDSEADLLVMNGGFDMLMDALGDGRLEDSEHKEYAVLAGDIAGIIPGPSSGCELLVQDANAARCNGRHPCRDSRIPAASG
jgi:hypothetical protein